MTIVKNFIDYTLITARVPRRSHGRIFPIRRPTPATWNSAGSPSQRLVLHEIQVDHAGDMGLTYYRLYLFTGDAKYLTAAFNVANTLASKARTGTATQSVWPYRVVMDTGKITAEYGANWMGCYVLLTA